MKSKKWLDKVVLATRRVLASLLNEPEFLSKSPVQGRLLQDARGLPVLPMPDSEKVSSEEAARIYREAQIKKQRAKDLKIPQLFQELYFDKIRYYPEWIKKDPRSVCSLITDVLQQGKGITRITLKNKEYVFSLKEEASYSSDESTDDYGLLELFTRGQRILALKVLTRYFKDLGDDPILPARSIIDVEAFVEDEWIHDFEELKKKSESEWKERPVMELVDDPKKLGKLKQDFGIK